MNLWLREATGDPNVFVVGTGELREDRYTLVQPDGIGGAYFASPEGYHSVLTRDPQTGIFQLRRPDGLIYEFDNLADTDASGKGLHRIRRIFDRFPQSNQFTFKYEEDPQGRLLIRIQVNDPSRELALQHDDLRRLTSVTDYSGRVVSYAYDDFDDLVAATLPASDGHPFGRTTFYSYSSEKGPVAHQLLTVIDADGRRYLDVEFGTGEGLTNFNRVVRQRDDEGEWLLEYADLVAPDDRTPETPTRYTLLTQPNGHQVEHWFNDAGNLLFKADSFFDEDGARQQCLWRHQYNRDGRLIATQSPGGVFTQYLYGRDRYMLRHGSKLQAPLSDVPPPNMQEWLGFGNQLAIIRRAVSASSWPPSALSLNDIRRDDVVQVFTYEPQFQLIAAASDPRTTATLDQFDLNRATHYDYADGSLKTINYPEVTDPEGNKHSSAEIFEHDAHGRLLTTMDAEDHESRREYFGAADHRPKESSFSLGAVLQPDAVSIEGFLKSSTVGATGPNPATTQFDVNRRGIVVQVTDPRLAVSTMRIDSTGRPLEIVRTVNPNVSYSTRLKYTGQVKVRRQERDIRDDSGNPLLEGIEVQSYSYSDTELLLTESVGGPDPATWLTTRHSYNSEGLPTRKISPGGSVTQLRHDPRRLVVAMTRGFGTPEAVTDRTRYDKDGRRRAVVDGRGNITRSDYDAFGRVTAAVQVIDRPVGAADDRPLQARQGHTRLFTYDKLDHVTSERFFEWRAPDTYALLSRSSTEYDERGRVIKIIRDLFDEPVIAKSGLEGLETVVPANATAVETWLFLDGNGEVKERREGVVTAGPEVSAGSSTTYQYDYSGRVTRSAIQLLRSNQPPIEISVSETTYDLNGNPTRTDRTDFQLDANGVVVSKEVISVAAEFDALNRRIGDIDGLGNRTRYGYDSRDLMLRRTDPFNNTVEFVYDRYGRRTEIVEPVDDLTRIFTKFQIAADGQITGVVRGDTKNPEIVKTEYEYDALNRQTARTLAAGTPLERRSTVVYDAAGNVSRSVHANGLREILSYDGLNRLSGVVFDRSGADPQVPILGVKSEIFVLDGLGRLTKAVNDVSEVDVKFDSLNRATEETQAINGGQTLTIRRRHDVLGNRFRLQYPSGRVLGFGFDLARRMASIQDEVPGTPNVSAPGDGIRPILNRTYIGLRRRRDAFGNGCSTDFRYDAAGRSIAFDHRDPAGASMLNLVHLYDSAGNRRHDWQSGSEAVTSSQPYAYDGVHRLISAGENARPLPDLKTFEPTGTKRDSLVGQADVDPVLAPLVPPAQEIKHSYVYDAGSNRTAEVISGLQTQADVDLLDQIKGQVYDGDGNPVSIGNRALRYDQHGHLVEVNGGAAPFSAIYDAMGRRIAIKEGPTEVRFFYDGFSEIAEYRDGILFSEHVVASPPDGRVLLAASGHNFVVHEDFVGSTRVLTDETGAPVAHYEFDPYGRALPGGTDLAVCRHQFMGREWDASIGLYHFRARHYDASACRFLQPDPAKSDPGRSAYQAFRSNPLAYVDPLGRTATHPGEQLTNSQIGVGILNVPLLRKLRLEDVPVGEHDVDILKGGHNGASIADRHKLGDGPAYKYEFERPTFGPPPTQLDRKRPSLKLDVVSTVEAQYVKSREKASWEIDSQLALTVHNGRNLFGSRAARYGIEFSVLKDPTVFVQVGGQSDGPHPTLGAQINLLDIEFQLSLAKGGDFFKSFFKSFELQAIAGVQYDTRAGQAQGVLAQQALFKIYEDYISVFSQGTLAWTGSSVTPSVGIGLQIGANPQ
jgi:RHS repeat-associated protein